MGYQILDQAINYRMLDTEDNIKVDYFCMTRMSLCAYVCFYIFVILLTCIYKVGFVDTNHT